MHLRFTCPERGGHMAALSKKSQISSSHISEILRISDLNDSHRDSFVTCQAWDETDWGNSTDRNSSWSEWAWASSRDRTLTCLEMCKVDESKSFQTFFEIFQNAETRAGFRSWFSERIGKATRRAIRKATRKALRGTTKITSPRQGRQEELMC